MLFILLVNSNKSLLIKHYKHWSLCQLLVRFNLTDNSYKTEFWLLMKYNKNLKLDSIQNQIEFINAKSTPNWQTAITNKKGNLNWYGAKYCGEFEKNWDVNSFPFDKQKLIILN
jgi:hypothetical protein